MVLLFVLVLSPYCLGHTIESPVRYGYYYDRLQGLSCPWKCHAPQSRVHRPCRFGSGERQREREIFPSEPTEKEREVCVWTGSFGEREIFLSTKEPYSTEKEREISLDWELRLG